MPQLTLEYSANLPVPVDLQRHLASIHEGFVTLGFSVDDWKTRVIRCEVYRVGTGAPERAFAHLTLALLDRNSPEAQRAAGERALQVLQAAFAGTELDCDLTVEVREMRVAGYFKARTRGTSR
jgi:5-carboxymethyl-2-hydroxymuconate isomerase